MSLASLIAAFQTNAIAQNGILTTAGLEALRTRFTSSQFGEVRIFVSAASGLGHQASSINILKRLIDFGCTETIRVIYEVSKSDPNLPKLKTLLPGFNPDNPSARYILDNVNLVFTAFSRGQNPGLDHAGLCICGGSEDKTNYAAADCFNVDLYFQLQPFQWTKQKNMLWRQGVKDPLVLSEQSILGGDGFIERAFYMPQPEVSDNKWDTLFHTGSNQNVLHIAELIDAYLSQNSEKKIDFLPVYGINDDWGLGRGIPTLPGTAYGILFTITAAVAASQASRTSAHQKPTVIGVLTDVHKDSWADFRNAVAGKLVSGQPNQFQTAMDWAVKNQLPTRVVVLDSTDPHAFDTAVTALQADQILVVRIPGLPPDIFNLLYAEATLPFVFEGQSTANLALNLGVPYMQLARIGINVYPSVFLGNGPFVTSQASYLTEVVSTTQNWLGLWPANADQTPAARLGTFITDATTQDSAHQIYFRRIGDFYGAEQNDKLLMSLLWGLQYLPQEQKPVCAGVGTQAIQLTTEEDPSPLQDFYNALTGNTQDGVLNLIPGAINKGIIFNFLTAVIGKDSFAVGNGTTAVTISFPDPYDEITVTGPTRSFESTDLDSSVVFRTAEDSTGLTAALKLHGTTSFSFDDAPWFEVNDTSITVTVSDSGQRIQGEVTGNITLGSKTLAVCFAYPAEDNRLRLTGDFGDSPASFNDVFQLLGGINFLPTLPSPLDNINSLVLKNLQLAYDYTHSSVSGFNVGLTTSADWPIFGKVALKKGATLDIFIASPTGSRKISWSAAGTIAVGPGTIELGITYPDIDMTAQMAEDSKPIPLGDFLTFFLPDNVTLDLAANVSALSMSVKPVDTPVYQVSGTLDTDWPVSVSGTTVFTLTSLSMDVQGTGTSPTGSISAQTRIFPDQSDISFELSVTADYQGDGVWTFSGELTDGTIKVVDILREYLPDGWVPGAVPSIDINDFSAKIESNGSSDSKNSYELGGTVKIWNLPFADSINFESTIEGKFGYKAKEGSNRLGLPRLRTSPAAVPIRMEGGLRVVSARAVGDGASKAGYYGEVAALINWANIELTLAYNFAPGVQQYQLTWGIFTGTLNSKKIDDVTHWITEITFSEGTTLGGMIETFISWATGSSFSLASPWNVLDNIPLSDFGLEFDITAGTVAFRVDIGPIELGFARLDAIKVRYNNNNTKPSKNSVLVEIEGAFRWQDSPSEPLSWDATKPETTPTPPGNGNKYIDLRLLAMGQHVTADGFSSATTVQKAIACMSDLPEPTAGTIPPITFDANSNWLIGTDFGVLRIDDGDDKGQYVVTLQVVFNDPNLYGLRLALAGDAAKIFKGLDFQIMYRKISDNLGVYQSEIALPTIMRKFQAGAFTITLPVFSIQVYTNGDFQIDIGFPWQEDISRSFTVEAIVPPGIPLIGSGGFYFGKLSSASTNKVPAVINGTFNPVIVFGFGAQLGLGKSIEAGILSAGFSLTVFGIIEGVLAKWNPYNPTESGNSAVDQLQGEYYFSLSGTMGVIGLLYGSVNFAVVKAEVNVEIKLYVQIIFASYQDIPLSVVASVNVSARITMNLGIFKIHLSFSFSTRIKETFVITTSHDAPWTLAPSDSQHSARLTRPAWKRLRDMQPRSTPLRTVALTPIWDHLLKPEVPLSLTGYCAPGLTMAGDAATTLAQQLPCYVMSMFIDSVPSADQDAKSSIIKAAGAATDTPFEALSKLVAKWAVASIQTNTCTPSEAGALIVTEDQLQILLDYLSDSSNPTPIPQATVETFLRNQVVFDLQSTNTAGEAHATFFPMPAALTLNIPEYKSWAGYTYKFTDYNKLSNTYLDELRSYFNQLAVQVQEMPDVARMALRATEENGTSIADFLFADYFLLIMRQMVQAISDGLRDFKYPIQSGDTGNKVVAWTNSTGQLSGDDAFSLTDLFIGNADHLLTVDKTLTIAGATHTIQPGETFTSIAALATYDQAFDARELALSNADTSALFTPDSSFTYDGQKVVLSGASSLTVIAASLNVPLDQLLTKSDLLTKTELLAPLGQLRIPPYPYQTKEDDTLTDIAGRLGVTVQNLATQDEGVDNGTVIDLFSVSSNANLDLAHLPAFQVDALLQEAQRTLAIQNLSGMTSRYYFSGLRLPTKGITPNARGMWVTENNGTLTLPTEAGLFALSGQQFPLPEINGTEEPDTFNIYLDGFTDLGWMRVPDGGDRYTVTVRSDSDENKAIQALNAYATTQPLAVGTEGLSPGTAVGRSQASYPLSSFTSWQSTAGITLPYGDEAEAPTSVTIRNIPQAMLALPDRANRDIDPRFALTLERYDEASGTIHSAPITDYSWASVANFTVKRVSDQSAQSPASLTTYELVGAGGQDANVLERLVESLGNQDNLLSGLALGYATSGTSDNVGLQTDSPISLTLGIAQVNLSTVTRPPEALRLAASVKANATDFFPRMLNTPTNFLQLVWEASITRAGGFFLYYENTATGTGLPERIFNDKGEAELSLIVLHAKPADVNAQNRLTNYVNAVVIGDKVNLSSANIVATSDDVTHTVPVSSTSTLAGIAYRYYANIADVAAAAAALPLATGAELVVNDGVYMISPLGTAPGDDPVAIAAHFGTSIAALQAANPRITAWSGKLPAYTVLRLPVLTITAGTSPGSQTLAAIADYYGVNLTGLAANNSDTLNLFSSDSSQATLSIKGGPFVLSAKTAAGIQSVAATRQVPSPVPDDPTASNYAVDFLTNTFSLLGYQIAANQDFLASNMGLPAGPQAPAGDGADKIQVPTPLEELDRWSYSLCIPYTQLSTLPCGKTGVSLAAEQSPYRGNGTLLQLDFSWHDLYGNRLITTLDHPQANSTDPLNRSPILIGYTDGLIALSRWPSVSSGWHVCKGENSNASIELLLTFAPSSYLSRQENPANGSDSWQENAARALPTMQSLVYQLTDPNGVAFSFDTSLTAVSLPLNTDVTQGLIVWVQAIFSFLQDRANGGQTVPTPSVSPSPTIAAALDPATVSSDQIFPLNLSFVIARTGGICEGDCATLSSVRRVATQVTPAADDDGSGSLLTFAADFRTALSSAGVYTLNVATGVNRTASLTESQAAVWAVRLGEKDGEGISYRIQSSDAPILLAPRPISNTLISRSGVPIYDYTTGTGIEWENEPSRRIDFKDIDVDGWTKQLFSAIDEVLTPAFTSSLLVLDTLSGNDYLDALLKYKETLAGITAKLMIPVYADQPELSTTERSAAQDAFRQQLLVALGNAYSVHAAVEFQADVMAAETKETAPNLYGAISGKTSTTVSFTSSKLSLATTLGQEKTPLVTLVSAPGILKDDSGAVREVLDVKNASYAGNSIEHQISSIPAVEGYKASSWLSFVETSATRKLESSLSDFQVPLILRSFPATPAMTDHSGRGNSSATGLNEILEWSYRFTYSLNYHYPQDRVYATVQFNIVDTSRLRQTSLADTFAALAEFVTVLPAVQTDLTEKLAHIDAKTTDQPLINEAATAIKSFNEIVDHVVEQAQSRSLHATNDGNDITGTKAEPYSFIIEEMSKEIKGVNALVVEIQNAPPDGIGKPSIAIGSYTTNVLEEKDGYYSFYFTGADGKLLEAAKGQAIGPRTVILPGMQVLQRQDAWASVYLKRNETLGGKVIASPFIYQTPEVRFATPLRPVIRSSKQMNIAALGSSDGKSHPRSLTDQLSALFSVLFKSFPGGDVTIQMNISYRYALNSDLPPLNLPVLMLPPLSISVEGTSQPSLASLISELSGAITEWFNVNQPVATSGALTIELTIMSNLTQNPMPLVDLDGLILPISYVDPPLKTN